MAMGTVFQTWLRGAFAAVQAHGRWFAQRAGELALADKVAHLATLSFRLAHVPE